MPLEGRRSGIEGRRTKQQTNIIQGQNLVNLQPLFWDGMPPPNNENDIGSRRPPPNKNKVNCKLIASCGESESKISQNLLRVLKKSPSSEFNSYIGIFQDKYDDGTNFDLDNFMCDIVIKYNSLVKDGQWNTKLKKDVKIIALTSQIQELKILFAKQ